MFTKQLIEQETAAPEKCHKFELAPLKFTRGEDGEVYATLTGAEQAMTVNMSALGNFAYPECEVGVDYYRAIEAAIKLAIVSEWPPYRQAGMGALMQMRDACGSIREYVRAGAYLCSPDQLRQVFDYASANFSSLQQFASEHGISEQEAEQLIKDSAGFSKMT